MSVQPTNRRQFLQGLTAAGLAAFTTEGVFAQRLVETPRLTEGPFYPNKLPLDTDNDLLILNDSITPAVGEITHLTGKVLDSKRRLPLRNAFVEIWQVDNTGAYINTNDSHYARPRHELPGLRSLPDRRSRRLYYFRTIKPIDYTLHGDVPHRAHSRRGQPERPPRLHLTAPGQRPSRRMPATACRRDSIRRALEDHPRGLQADAGLEARRAERELRHRAGLDGERARTRRAPRHRTADESATQRILSAPRVHGHRTGRGVSRLRRRHDRAAD